MLGTDEILKAANREPIFTSFLGSILNQVLPANLKQDSVKLINQNLTNLQSNNSEILATDNLLNRFKNLNLNGDISKEEFTEFQKLIQGEAHKNDLLSKNLELKSKIKDLIDKKF